MLSQSSAELVEHRKIEKDGEAVEEDEDDEYGVGKTVMKLNPREPSKEEMEEHEKTHLPFRSWSDVEAMRRPAEKP